MTIGIGPWASPASGDFGEDNGQFDYDPDRARWLVEDPLTRVAASQDALYRPQEVREVHRLDQVIERPALEAERGGRRIVHCGEHQDREVGVLIQELGDQVGPGLVRQPEVEQHAADPPGPHDVESFGAGRRGVDVVLLLGQEAAEGVPDRLLVIHDENADRSTLRLTNGRGRRR